MSTIHGSRPCEGSWSLFYVSCNVSIIFLQVAIICNHQRSVSKSHSAQMERLTARINDAKVFYLQEANIVYAYGK